MPGDRLQALALQPEALQQVAQHGLAVGGAGAHVADGLELGAQRGHGGHHGVGTPGLAEQGGFGLAGAHGCGGHAAGADGDGADLAFFQRQADGEADGGDVVVETFADFVDAKEFGEALTPALSQRERE